MADSPRIEQLQDEIDLLRKTVNELARAQNLDAMFLMKFRTAQAELAEQRWYRMCLWLRPISLPLYQKRPAIRQLEKPPQMLSMAVVELDDIDDATA